jgi:hypothetical protein
MWRVVDGGSLCLQGFCVPFRETHAASAALPGKRAPVGERAAGAAAQSVSLRLPTSC